MDREREKDAVIGNVWSKAGAGQRGPVVGLSLEC